MQRPHQYQLPARMRRKHLAKLLHASRRGPAFGTGAGGGGGPGMAGVGSWIGSEATAGLDCFGAGSGGGAAAATDQEKRDQAQAAMAASEPVLEMQVEAGRIRLDTRNIKACTLCLPVGMTMSATC